jgi:alcohol dehydrogenase class IV
VSYGITNHHGIPHGRAVWLTLPEIFKMHEKADTEQVSDARGGKHLQEIMHKLMKSLNIEVAEQADTILKNFMIRLGTTHNFTMIGADTAEQRAFLAKQANMERMSNNPVSFTDRDISEIFSLH